VAITMTVDATFHFAQQGRAGRGGQT
jgi:hypothetical protein